MANKFRIPEVTFIGEGALEAAKEALSALGKKALIVSGNSMIRQGHVDRLCALLEQNGIAHAIFSGIPGEPTDEMIEEGFAVYQKEACDFIIGIGGGSPLDSAKAIGVLAAYGGSISDHNGKVITKEIPPLVEIPSTAGTGSEVTPFTIITDTKKDIKMLLKGDTLMPKVAIVDPAFSMETPKNVTIATGLDALTHAVEAYTSKKAFPESDLFALSAVRRIFRYLPEAVKDGGNKKAREEMAIAAYEAGISFGNSSVTVVHGMSRPIGALFHVPHGISNAMLLKECLTYVADGAYERFADLADVIGAGDAQADNREKAFAFIDRIASLCEFCEVPTLEKYGIDREKFFANIEKMSQDALDSGSPGNTRKPLTKEDLITLYKKLW